MYSLKVLSISKSGKSVFATVTKVAGIFSSTIATGSIKLDDGAAAPEVGSIIKLDGVTKVSTVPTEVDGKEFIWLVLE